MSETRQVIEEEIPEVKLNESQKEETRKDCVIKLRGFLEWSNAMPTYDPGNGPPDPIYGKHFKVRKVWASNILAYADLAREAELLSGKMIEAVVRFTDRYSTPTASRKTTTREDILRFDWLARELIKELERPSDNIGESEN